ncbi:MAG: hypothetical protein MUC71_02315 [Steroidobacteraceae bacterium]|jgi:hypothetical protein|nr:hypothetical protein [Steroidobacteraceae bacterium]
MRRQPHERESSGAARRFAPRPPALLSLLVFPGAIATVLVAGAEADRRTETPQEPVVRFVPLPPGQSGFAGALPEIYVEGAIGDSTFTQLRQLVDEQGLTAARVRFDSRGGDLLAAIEIGYYLREKEFVTEVAAFGGAWGRFVPGQCLSACAVAYLGGKYRYLDPGARFAVHRFSTERAPGEDSPREVEAETQALAALLVGYIRHAGVDVEFFDRMSARPHADLDYLGMADLRRMGVVNDGRMPPSWDLEILEDEVVLAGRQERLANGAAVTLRCGEPVEIHVSSQHFDEDWRDTVVVSAIHWTLGDERVPVDPRTSASSWSVQGGEFRAALAVAPALAGRLPSAGELGLAVTASGRRYEYAVNVATAADREKIRGFVEFCSRSGGTGRRPPTAG